MKKRTMFIIFVVGALVIYNLLPYLSTLREAENYDPIGFISIVFLNPIYIIACCFINGKKYDFSWILPLILCLCFIPTVFIFYKPLYLFYLLIYFVFAIPSEILGISFRRISKII